MINLSEYLDYWAQMPERINGLRSVMAVTVDQEMGTVIQGLKSETCPILFVIIPSSRSDARDVDGYMEENQAVVFVMDRYDAQRGGAVRALIDTQPVMEDIKRTLLDDVAAGCPVLGRLNVGSLSTIPETGFFRSFGGWSLGFSFYTE